MSTKSNRTPESGEEDLYLIGRPTLRGFLRFIRHEAVNPEDKATLIEEWEEAKRHVDELRISEADHADNPSFTRIDVDGKYRPLMIDFLQDPIVKNGFNSIPSEIAMVELDSMVVYQHHINLTHVAEMQEKIGPNPSDEDVFRVCLTNQYSDPPVKWQRMDDGSFVFISPSNDLRSLGHKRLKAENIVDSSISGGLVALIGQSVGFGSNLLNAFYVENRLILNNGSHRAYALRDMGVTHVPCIVRHVSTRDELDVVGASAILRRPDHFLKKPRPSMLKDYFNPKLRKVLPVHKRLKQVTVRISVKENYIPTF